MSWGHPSLIPDQNIGLNKEIPLTEFIHGFTLSCCVMGKVADEYGLCKNVYSAVMASKAHRCALLKSQ